jgi:tRNA1Val (adenine37-N6)-methyltransferase
MANPYFSFKQFTVFQGDCAMKVTTDACLFGAWCAEEIKNSKINKCLDIGAGTGLLSMMVAQKNESYIDAVEIDEQAWAQARANVAASIFSNQINVINCDINLFHTAGYDVIISNPPFYENELPAATASRNSARHSIYLRWEHLFRIISTKLTAEGCFFLLLPGKREREMEQFLAAEHLYAHNVVYVKQTTGHSPFRIMIKGSKQIKDRTKEVIAVCDNHRQYTPRFKALLRDYYLLLALSLLLIEVSTI